MDQTNHHLWIMTNDVPDQLLEFDVTNAGSPVLIQGPMTVPWLTSTAGNAGAGLSYNDTTGCLVAVNQDSGNLETFVDLIPAGAGGIAPSDFCQVSAGSVHPWGLVIDELTNTSWTVDIEAGGAPWTMPLAVYQDYNPGCSALPTWTPTVPPTPAPTQTPPVGCPVYEDFEGVTFPPSGWTQTIANAGFSWNRIEPLIYFSGTYVLDCVYDDNPTPLPQDEWIITPPIDLSAVVTPFIKFGWMMSYYWGVDPFDNYDLVLQISTDGGMGWMPLWSESDEGVFDDFTWVEKAIDLGVYATETNVMFAWQYVGFDGAQAEIDFFRICDGSSYTPTPVPTDTPIPTMTPTPVPTLSPIWEETFEGCSGAGHSMTIVDYWYDDTVGDIVYTSDGNTWECTAADGGCTGYGLAIDDIADTFYDWNVDLAISPCLAYDPNLSNLTLEFDLTTHAVSSFDSYLNIAVMTDCALDETDLDNWTIVTNTISTVYTCDRITVDLSALCNPAFPTGDLKIAWWDESADAAPDMIDNIVVFQFDVPEPTPTPRPIPATGPVGIGFMVVIISGLLGITAVCGRK